MSYTRSSIEYYLDGKKYELFEENTKILRTLCIFALWWRLMKPLQKDSSVTIIVILLSPLSRAPYWLNDQGTHTTIAMHWNFQTRRPPTTYGRFASKQPDLDFWALALQWISMLESSSFILCILNTSNCLILHGEIFLLFTFYHVIQFLYPMQWLILTGAIIEKRNMGIGPIKIQTILSSPW